MNRHRKRASRTFVGQLERDCDGVLWAALYAGTPAHNGSLLTREIVRSTRHGRRRVADLVLAEADAAGTLSSRSHRHLDDRLS